MEGHARMDKKQSENSNPDTTNETSVERLTWFVLMRGQKKKQRLDDKMK